MATSVPNWKGSQLLYQIPKLTPESSPEGLYIGSQQLHSKKIGKLSCGFFLNTQCRDQDTAWDGF